MASFSLLAFAVALLAPPPPRLEQLLRKHGPQLLEGYRVPGSADVIVDWRIHSSERKALPYHVTADFNGDGQPDHAFLLLGERLYDIRLGALVSAGTSYRAFKLMELDAEDEFTRHRYIVSARPPGRYKAAAPEGDTPKVKPPGEVVAANWAIELIFTESSETLFLWDARRDDFKSVVLDR